MSLDRGTNHGEKTQFKRATVVGCKNDERRTSDLVGSDLVVITTANDLVPGGLDQNCLFKCQLETLIGDSLIYTCSNWAVYEPGISTKGGYMWTIP